MLYLLLEIMFEALQDVYSLVCTRKELPWIRLTCARRCDQRKAKEKLAFLDGFCLRRHLYIFLIFLTALELVRSHEER